MVGALVLSPTDAASQEPMVGSAQCVVVARARAPRDAAAQYPVGAQSPESDVMTTHAQRSPPLARCVQWMRQGGHLFQRNTHAEK